MMLRWDSSSCDVDVDVDVSVGVFGVNACAHIYLCVYVSVLACVYVKHSLMSCCFLSCYSIIVVTLLLLRLRLFFIIKSYFIFLYTPRYH